MFIKVVKLGEAIRNAQLPEGTTLADVINGNVGLELDATAADVRVNGSNATPETVLEDGDILTAVPSVKGGLQ